MKVTILTFGTQGDVQPFIALSKGLQAAGYDVTLGADIDFETMIVNRHIRYAPLRLNLKDYLNSDEGRAAMADQKENKSVDTFETMVRPMLDDCWEAAQGAQGIIYDTMLFPAYHIADKLGIPSIMASVMPNMSPTREFSLIGAPKIGFGRLGNRLSYLLYRLSWLQGYSQMQRWCRDSLNMRLPSRFIHYGYRNGKPIPTLYCYSQLVMPSPKDWHETVLASGYWFLETEKDWQPPAALEKFVTAGPAPVSIGFGSMVGLEPEHLTDIVLSAVAKTGERAVLITGWGGMVEKKTSDSVFFINNVQHDWLFPRMKAVVHHGGAGTTAAGLRFGKPTVICPFVTDQFFWGDIIYRRGFGPKPIPQKQLTVDKLAVAIDTAVTDTVMQRRVVELSEGLRCEDGIGKAIQFINQHFSNT
jgi:sterol 3beta-glucosyltransferase